MNKQVSASKSYFQRGSVSEFQFTRAQDGMGCKLHSNAEPPNQTLQTFEIFCKGTFNLKINTEL